MFSWYVGLHKLDINFLRRKFCVLLIWSISGFILLFGCHQLIFQSVMSVCVVLSFYYTVYLSQKCFNVTSTANNLYVSLFEWVSLDGLMETRTLQCSFRCQDKRYSVSFLNEAHELLYQFHNLYGPRMKICVCELTRMELHINARFWKIREQTFKLDFIIQIYLCILNSFLSILQEI